MREQPNSLILPGKERTVLVALSAGMRKEPGAVCSGQTTCMGKVTINCLENGNREGVERVSSHIKS